MNNCFIKYCGTNKDNGIDRYWCLKHKDSASDEYGNKLNECLCEYKDIYNNIKNINKNDISSIKIVYENILKDLKPILYINDNKENCAIKIENSILDFKDIGGLMISKLNNIDLNISYCTYCGKPHTDNGVFAYTPHSKHLCQYCGYFYKIDTPNIGNEMELYFEIPNIKLEDKTLDIIDKLCLEYDVLKGVLLLNGKSVNKINRPVRQGILGK